MSNTNNNVQDEPYVIKQVPFEVPIETYKKMLTGEYKQHGGVVRHAIGEKKGQIVEHLKQADQPETDSEIETNENAEMWEQFAQFIKEHKIGAAITILVTGACTGAGLWLLFRQPKYIKKFHAAFAEYIDEINNANLSVDTINQLVDSIEEVKAHKRYKKKLSIESIEPLVGFINQYTINLLENNNVELTDDELNQTDDCIIDLENYLKKQKKLFDSAM